MDNIFVFGEVLWDVYPDKKVIGGAPFNFSAHLAALGTRPFLISAVGDDDLGLETLSCIKDKQVDSTYVYKIANPTGVCNVTLDENKIPTYRLIEGVAYDNITLSDTDFERIKNSENKSLYVGTLSLRNKTSADTFKKLVEECEWKDILFDINIRQSFYSAEIVDYCLNACTVLKFSREEAGVFCELGLSEYDGCEENPESLCIDLADKYDINCILLTLDKDGGAVYIPDTDTFVYSEKPCCDVVSTVGAGDSFFAAYISSYLGGADEEKCLSDAIAVSGYVVEHIEAIPEYSEKLLKSIGR